MNIAVATEPSMINKLDELFKPWSRSDGPGGVVGVMYKGKLLYRRGFGLASIEHAKANTPTTRMRIGSTTKHFCSLSIMLLAEEGKLDINQPLRTYLPELTNVCGEPTLLQLMHHTGGLRDPMMTALMLNRGTFGHMPAEASLQLMTRFTERNFAPGERMAYSNSGYFLLTLVVERLSGMAWDAFLKQRIFSVLGMKETMLLASDLDIVPNMATLHMPQPDGQWRRGIYPSDELLGSGGLISTVDDMLTWIAHLRAPAIEKKVGGAATWAKMLEWPTRCSGQRAGYCLALTRENYRGVEIIHHAGATLGSQCQMLTVPAHELDIIVMSNRMDLPAPAVAQKIIDIVLEEKGLAPAIVPPPAADFPALQGSWFSAESRTLMTISAKVVKPGLPELLLLALYNSPVAVLLKRGEGLAIAEGPMSMIEIRKPPAGQAPPSSLDVHIVGDLENFVRLPDLPPSAAELAPELVGRYRYSEFGTEMEVLFKDNKLFLDYLPDYGLAQWELTPFSTDVLGCGILHTIPASAQPNSASMMLDRRDGKVIGFWISADRARNIRFDRLN